MTLQFSQLIQYIIPLIILGAGIFLGILFQKIALTKLIKAAEKTKIKINEILIKPFKGVIIF